VCRLAASFVIAGRANGFSKAQCTAAATAAARSYRERIARYAEMPVLDAYYEYIDLKKLVLATEDTQIRQLTLKRIRKAQAESANLKEFTKLAYQAGDQPRIRDEPPLIYHDPDLDRQKDLDSAFEEMINAYVNTLPPERRMLAQRYRLVDVATKVVGVGSVGTYCGIALMISGNGDSLFLQFKEARASVLEPYCGRVPMTHHGERVVFGQRLLQSSSDIFLGWTTNPRTGRHFYVRQLRDAKIKPMVEVMNPRNLSGYASACGWALARGHKRSGDAVMLAGYMGTNGVFDRAMAGFAIVYADQNERDHSALVTAVRAGRVEARVSV